MIIPRQHFSHFAWRSSSYHVASATTLSSVFGGLSLSFSAIIFSPMREANGRMGACAPLQDEPHMQQWKSFCIFMHIRKGKAGHSVGITRDSLTKQQKCNMKPDFAQFTGSTATRRALAACQNYKSKLECFRQRWLRCVCSSQLLFAPATGQEDVRSWESCRAGTGGG